MARRGRLFRMIAMLGRVTFPSSSVCRRVATMLFMKLLRAMRTFKFMALARDCKNRHGHKEEGEKFHRAASIATRR